jgi:hypothetical protein
VVKRLSQGAAAHAVSGDFAGVGPNLLSAGLGASSGDANFELELERLFLRLLGRGITEQEISTYGELFEAVVQEASEEAAWRSLISVLMRDPEFVSY